MRLTRRDRGHRRRSGSRARLAALIAVPALAAAAAVAVLANPAGSTPAAHPAPNSGEVKALAQSEGTKDSTWTLTVTPVSGTQYQEFHFVARASGYDPADPPTGDVYFYNFPGGGKSERLAPAVTHYLGAPVQRDDQGVYAESYVHLADHAHYGDVRADYNTDSLDPDYKEKYSNSLVLDVAQVQTTTTGGVNRTTVDLTQDLTLSAKVTLVNSPDPALKAEDHGNLKFSFTAAGKKDVEEFVGLRDDGTSDTTFDVKTLGLSVATWNVQACYGSSDDRASDFGSSCSQTTQVKVVEPVQPAPTTTTLTASPSPATDGETVTITAKVASATGTLTGSVHFNADGMTDVDAPIKNNVATWKVSDLGVGAHQITAKYAGDAAHEASDAKPIWTVVRALPKTVVHSDLAVARECQLVTFTATVGGVEVTPTGKVTFAVDGKSAATVPLDKSGKAVWKTKDLKDGNRQVVAKYSGDGGYAANDSAPLTERITHGSCGGHTTPPPTTHPGTTPLPAVHGGDSKPSGGGGSLASTGAKVATLLSGAVLLLGAGGALMVFGRRRRTSRHGL